MNINIEDLDQIRRDENTLNELIAVIEEGYSYLAGKCAYAMGGVHDDEDEDEDDEIEFVDNLARGLMPLEKQVITSDETDVDTDMPEDNDDIIFFDGEKSSKKESLAKDVIPIKTLYRLIKQASHPDKIMRFSAVQKKEILDCFHESTTHMEDENLQALVFCYVRLFLIRQEPKRITYWLWQYVSERHIQILRHFNYLMARPFMDAIRAWKNGDEELAIRAFQYYLKHKEVTDAQEADDDIFNADDFE